QNSSTTSQPAEKGRLRATPSESTQDQAPSTCSCCAPKPIWSLCSATYRPRSARSTSCSCTGSSSNAASASPPKRSSARKTSATIATRPKQSPQSIQARRSSPSCSIQFPRARCTTSLSKATSSLRSPPTFTQNSSAASQSTAWTPEPQLRTGAKKKAPNPTGSGAENVLAVARNYFAKLCTAAASESKTSNTVSSFVTCSTSWNFCPRFDSFSTAPWFRALWNAATNVP